MLTIKTDKFTVKIETDIDTFLDNEEEITRKILDEIRKLLKETSWSIENEHSKGLLHDKNWNEIGKWKFKE